MKSIVEEASSIVKAIEAAWIRAEKPQEFSVKIFEEPEKNFFGMVTKSAKIALIFKHVEKRALHKEQAGKYKPAPESTYSTQSKEFARKEQVRHETASRETGNREPREQREPRERREPREQREPREFREQREPRELREPREPREQREQREPREHREPMVRELPRKETAPKQPREASPAPREQLRITDSLESDAQEKIFWTDDMVAITREWIETLLKNLECSDVSFTLEPKRYYLTISFSKSVRETKALEQQLFRSCAYLIMQMLRTKLKKQFRGLKVVLHSPA